MTYRNVPFAMMTPMPHEHESLHNEVRALCEDKLGNLWVGLKDGMLRMYDADKAYKGYLTESGIVSTTGTPMLELFILLFRIRKESSGLQQKETDLSVPSRLLPTECLIN